MEEERLFDLVVRRFLSCFDEDAVREAGSVEISVGEHRFKIEETRVLVAGGMKVAAGGRPTDGASSTASTASALREGDRVDVEAVTVEEHLRQHPVRYNQATLLEKMEKEGIGTKATRADIISTLLARGYVAGGTLIPTELGFALVETMREHCPQIISTRLTRDIRDPAREDRAPPVTWAANSSRRRSASLLTQIGEVRSHEGRDRRQDEGLGVSF